MDKETLSNYGWIVICVLVLAVMIALATPFGDFIANSVKSTTQGLFDTNKKALNSTGLITIEDQGFEEKNNDLHNTVVPIGGTYIRYINYRYDFAIGDYIYDEMKIWSGNNGDVFPEICDGDIYQYGDYEYVYHQEESPREYYHAGWTVGLNTSVTDIYQTEYGDILTEINTAKVTSMYQTFKNCNNISAFAKIPNSITSMNETFENCASLTDARKIILPNSIIELNGTFENCVNLVYPPNIPNSIIVLAYTFNNCTSLLYTPDLANCTNLNNMFYTFSGCTSLTNVTSEIPCSVEKMVNVFQNCYALTGIIEINAIIRDRNTMGTFSGVDFKKQNILLTGNSNELDRLGKTGINYCEICNGFCNNNHE